MPSEEQTQRLKELQGQLSAEHAKIGSKAVDKFTPKQDFILVEVKRRNETAGGVALPEGADPEPPRGRVIKCGPGRITEFGARITPEVCVGDMVYLTFAVHSPPIKMNLDGKEYLLVRAREVIAGSE